MCEWIRRCECVQIILQNKIFKYCQVMFTTDLIIILFITPL